MNSDATAAHPVPRWHDDVFFGIHYDLHADATDTELGAELTVEHLIERLRRVAPDWIQCDCKGHAGYTSWPTTTGTTSPGVVHDALRMHREATRVLGIPLGVHYSGVWDTVAIERHPEWGRVDEHGERVPIGEGRPDMTGRLSGYDRELMIPQLLELMDEYDVDGFWVDGENWASFPDWSDEAIAGFTRRTGISDIPRGPDDTHWLAWLAFHRDLFVEHVAAYTTAVHDRKPGCLVASNWMYTMRQPEPIAAPVDYLSGDFDHAWGADRAAVEGRLLDSRGVSWDLMAWGFTKAGTIGDQKPWILKSATMLAQECSEVVALGGAVMIYDTPQRTGWLTSWHQDTLAEVARFCRARKEVCFRSTSRSQIAILHSHVHYYGAIDGLYAAGDDKQPIEGSLHALLEAQRSTEVVTEEALLDGLDQYRLVIIPERTQIGDAVRAALRGFVADGGQLLLSGPRAAASFPEFVGADPAGDPLADPVWLPVGQRAVGLSGPWQPVTPGGNAEVWTHALDQQEVAKDATDRAIVVHHRIGEGGVTSIHGPFFAEYHAGHPPLARTWLHTLIDRLAIPWEVEVEGPPALEVVTRTQGDALVINLINRGAGEALSPRRVQYDTVPPIHGVAVRVRRDVAPATVSLVPGGEPVDWSFVAGTLTIRVPVVHIHDVLVVT